jgi:K+-sensing histidine kinase KdpD
MTITREPGRMRLAGGMAHVTAAVQRARFVLPTRSGIGLGLPICAGFCEAMGVGLDLAPTPGGGLTARVVLEPAR